MRRNAPRNRIGSDSDGFTNTNAANAARAAQLISLPRVWRRGGDPATTWASSVATLFPMTREASSRVSFPDPPFAEDRRRGHSDTPRAWALGNLVEGASAGLETCGSRVEKWARATRFAEAAASLLRRLPPGTTLSSSVVAEMDDAEMDDAEIERGEIDAVFAHGRGRRGSLFRVGRRLRERRRRRRGRRARRRDDVALSSLVRRFVPSTRRARADRLRARPGVPQDARGRVPGGRAPRTDGRRTKATASPRWSRARCGVAGTPSFRPPRRRRTRLARARFPPSSPRSPRGSGPRTEAR